MWKNLYSSVIQRLNATIIIGVISVLLTAIALWIETGSSKSTDEHARRAEQQRDELIDIAGPKVGDIAGIVDDRSTKDSVEEIEIFGEISDNYNNVFRLSLLVAPENMTNRSPEASIKEYGWESFSLQKGETELEYAEFVFPKGCWGGERCFHWEHGFYEIDGFFRITDKYRSWGAISLTLQPVDPERVLLR